MTKTKTEKWFDREFSGRRIIEATASPKSNPKNKRQDVSITTIRTRDKKMGRVILKAGGISGGTRSLTDEQTALVLAAAAR